MSKVILIVVSTLLAINHLVIADPVVIAGSSGVSPPPFWENSFWGMTSSIERAFPFTVPSDGPYIVEELEVAAYHYEGMAGSTAYFSINIDNNGEPGDVLAIVELSDITTSQQVLCTAFTEELTLNSDTAYWLVGGTTQGQVNWNLGDMAFGTAAYRVDQDEWVILSDRNVSAYAILGSPVPEPTAPPVADADGPYNIEVGDMLTLDASASTDEDDDITSYMWDLDDDENFETDAGGQAVFDVNFACLQSLGLLINYTYTIHLQVTDSEGQSDVADSTLIIVPKPAVKVAVDIKPTSCPNPVNVKSSGVLPIAILGTDDYDITTIDPTSIRLAGVEPLRSGYEDVATPVSDGNDCNCITDGPDGFLDLTLKFETQRIVEAVGDVNDGDVRVLTLTGVLFDPMPFETPIEGADCILIRGRHKPINPADINKDGVVNAADFAIFAQNWLQSSIVGE